LGTVSHAMQTEAAQQHKAWVESMLVCAPKKLRVAELRAALAERGLSTDGLKAVLLDRLLACDAKAARKRQRLERLSTDEADEHGRTPLWKACYEGQVDAARLLLDNGAEVDRADENGVTPLHIACLHGHVDAARLLLEKGAEVNKADEDGHTPLDAAKLCRHDAVVALIEDHQSARDAEAARKRQRLVQRPLEISKEERTPRREWVGDSFVI